MHVPSLPNVTSVCSVSNMPCPVSSVLVVPTVSSVPAVPNVSSYKYVYICILASVLCGRVVSIMISNI